MARPLSNVLLGAIKPAALTWSFVVRPNVTFSGAPLAGRPLQGGVGSLRTKKWEQPEYDLSLL